MGNKPLVSIIITTYKRHDYLERAINSVLSQTYTNIEVIIVDDNDSTTEYSTQVQLLIEKMNDDRIHYVSMGKNSGACAARNRGFMESKGNYVDFLDDDDEFHPQKIELQMDKFDNVGKDVGMIGCFAQIKDQNGNVTQYDRNGIRGDVFFANLCHSLCQTSLPLIRREVFEQSGGFENIISSQEHLMLARVLDVCPYYDFVEKELVTIYHHTGERISNGEKKPLGAIALAEKFKRYYYKLSEAQIREVELCMNANIINAYLLVNQRNKAILYYKQRRHISKKIGKEELKLLFGILFGSRVKQYIHKILLKIRG